MDQKWICVLVILVFYQRMTSADTILQDLQEGQKVEIKCAPKEGSIVVWWRVLDTSGMEFIASFSFSTGMLKTSLSAVFSHSETLRNTLTLKSFSKSRDSGVYFCASLKQNALHFGGMTRLSGAATVEKAKTTAGSEVTRPPTPAPCVCDDKGRQGSAGDASTSCAPIILGPLAGSCGLLLLLLLVISVHCNKIRTRRCPHHYKKKPRAMPPGKQVMTNRQV